MLHVLYLFVYTSQSLESELQISWSPLLNIMMSFLRKIMFSCKPQNYWSYLRFNISLKVCVFFVSLALGHFSHFYIFFVVFLSWHWHLSRGQVSCLREPPIIQICLIFSLQSHLTWILYPLYFLSIGDLSVSFVLFRLSIFSEKLS